MKGTHTFILERQETKMKWNDVLDPGIFGALVDSAPGIFVQLGILIIGRGWTTSWSLAHEGRAGCEGGSAGENWTVYNFG